jgi:prepilin-type N-terminal cleavage/methylation domain-containing protein
MLARRSNERGLSLIEVLVATAVLALALVVALTVYDASRKTFAKGENATEQQESVRIAFDLMSSDLRMLGVNVNPDGNVNRPDEQLEGALDHAVIFRGDFDGSDAAASVTPETALSGAAFPTVSTGNDEIVAYVLSKPDGSGPDSITFQADVAEPQRDGDVEPVIIDNVVLDPTEPPYTLYRVTLNNDSSKYGSPAFVVRTPVAENVRNVSFVYYNAAGTFKDASATIPETAAAKAMRSSLTRVGLSLVGMTRQQDFDYVDASDALAPRHRKFELKGDITPRNMRLKGIQDLHTDVTPPTKPATPALIAGHCKGLLATWAANPIAEGVTQYRISWGPSSSIVSGSRNVPGSPFFLDGMVNGSAYFVSIQAQDAEGNLSARSDQATATVTNVNIPSAPAGLTTSTDQTYHVAVVWTPVTTNTANAPSGDPLAPRIRDLAGYRLYSHSNSTVALTEENRVADETVLTASLSQPYLDTPLVACLDRYYVLTAVDTCGNESAPTPFSRGRVADSGVKPQPPGYAQAHFVGGGGNTAQVKWRQISQDVSGRDIKIERYEVFRSAPIDGALPADSAAWDPTPLAVVYANSYLDAAVPALASGEVVYYRVIGGDSCRNDSDPSSPAKLECAFQGDVGFVTPRDGQSLSGSVSTTVTAPQCTDCIAVTITYVHSTKGLQRKYTSSTPATSWTDTGWSAVPHGDYTITATVTNTAGCVETQTIFVTAAPPPQTGP